MSYLLTGRAVVGRSKSIVYKKQSAAKRRAGSHTTVRSVLALPVFPGRCQPSIVGRSELNYRVRNGNGWTLALISTNFVAASAISLASTLCYSVARRTSYIIGDFLSPVKKRFGDPYRIRTDVNGVRGRCLNHLTNGPRRRCKLHNLRFGFQPKLIHFPASPLSK